MADSELELGVTSQLSPVEQFIVDSGIVVTPPEEIVVQNVKVRTMWIAELDELFCVAEHRNDAVLKLSKAMAIPGWEKISW